MFLFLKAIVLGIVEGVTEFLPISSTGHLILVNQWIAFDPAFTKVFDVVIQLGAILAVVVYFRKEICPCTSPKEKRPEIFALWKKLLIGVLPAIILGALFASKIEEKLFNPFTVAVALVVGGIFLIVVEKRKHKESFTSIKQLPIKTVLLIGLFQCLAMIPGTSRSAATIIGALLLGASRVVAVEFSFFLAIPTMIAASAYTLVKHWQNMSSTDLAVLAVGFLTAFFSALLVISCFMKFIRKHSLATFGHYRIILGLLILLFLK
ncbi:undecaprenyl-diphosphatase [Candidatus Uhrbacteria bacterium RIFCSPLOWO2_02_FULL_48_18]|uniref:Undecaprenyl-diphosphatase n=1 Tax=Candidatus Uhrbacteria bacterium RIFCSPLOWO2_02_FULL_48_18 TaxID=1802408 RepID=A0A1F7V888_9BACT|nr:MAG: undecaprenyl-diphosphatase [Candidatus Uhrbacteria bacterium RIFCSPHIGHO2_01_FULL_47_10]OGL80325.1 MAG: undecaprenyl-diphosphatase [Candidatus Uhrbacteria bacterium RIFCSPLOWO2_01_FULL_47_17]OGL86184.1 MAG: undecaprenyl-diphosphatase [Candidatus Uhrbacteria bacterium RIFCSPLOWO2_02_FULL_48_18]